MPGGEGGRRPRLRVVVAVAATLLSGLVCWVAAVVARGRGLEDGCITREPSELWAPVRLTHVVRGPIPEGLLTYRCESVVDPRYGYSFTDPVPLVATLMAAVVWLGVVVLVWAVALRRGPASRPPRASSASRSP